ncbi:Divalent metal cation (Fe/Co/Zn/Cd) transporter [Roseomonas rosea]|uniref:Divalent metal cation (Fe/Co/Zn/Cd) transporter n=1 Tax=Muricoccus roseus TaxID=198092 RepID=A0A1M6E3W9_9PROT|nr:cation transporter [Roseomonas rosea]SHI80192.1 Divalent metal cation (Fe/Co/Zn/Cd) transporter [Roseomonas rosea]
MDSATQPDAAALRRERSILIACLLDCAVIIPYVAFGLAANSLTMVAEAMRGGAMVTLELVLLVVLRRIHRGRMTEYDYGVGKLEQFANLAIGVVMGACGLWLLFSAVTRWWHPPEQAGLGLLLGTALAFANLALNALALRALWLAGRDGTSAIMTVQIRSRVVKLLSSVLVAIAIGVNAGAELLGNAPGWLGPLAEALGTGFVGIVMVQLSISLWREAVPHLLDRSLDEARQASINRALATHFTGYDAMLGVKSRIAGNLAIIDIALGFEPGRRIGEIQAVTDAVSAELQALSPGALVTVTPVALPR